MDFSLWGILIDIEKVHSPRGGGELTSSGGGGGVGTGGSGNLKEGVLFIVVVSWSLPTTPTFYCFLGKRGGSSELKEQKMNPPRSASAWGGGGGGGEASPAPPPLLLPTPPYSLDKTLLVATYMVSCPGNGFWER